MKSKVIIFLLSLSIGPVFAQEEAIVISEKKTGKRLVLMAENKTPDTLNVFLMVQSEGYRRSADKPVLKDIPPKTKLPMITLVELTNIPSSYTYELIVNEKEKAIELDYGKEVVDIENVLKGKIVLFTLPNCGPCEILAKKLQDNRVSFRAFNIAEDPVLYKQFMKFIENELTESTRIKFPVVWNKTHTIFGFDDVDEIAEILNN